MKALILLDDALKRDFCVGQCRLESWSYRPLQDRIQSLLFVRSAFDKKPNDIIRHQLEVVRQEQQPTPKPKGLQGQRS